MEIRNGNLHRFDYSSNLLPPPSTCALLNLDCVPSFAFDGFAVEYDDQCDLFPNDPGCFNAVVLIDFAGDGILEPVLMGRINERVRMAPMGVPYGWTLPMPARDVGDVDPDYTRRLEPRKTLDDLDALQ